MRLESTPDWLAGQRPEHTVSRLLQRVRRRCGKVGLAAAPSLLETLSARHFVQAVPAATRSLRLAVETS